MSFFYEEPTFIEPGFKQYWYPDQSGVLRAAVPVKPEDGFRLPPLPYWSDDDRPPTLFEGLKAAVFGYLPRIWWRRKTILIKLPVIRWQRRPEPIEDASAYEIMRAVAKEQGYI